MAIKIKFCSTRDIIPIRHEVLRKGRPVSACNFEGDHNKSTIHFAAYDKEGVIGCLSLMKNNHEQFSTEYAFQLRGMAILPTYQNRKIGHLLLSNALDELVKNHVELVWCNVRLAAIPFYTKHFFVSMDSQFDIPDVGPHIMMYKKLGNA